MKKNNPFTLTFGKKPGEYISRYENTDAVISAFEADNPISQAYLIEGIRGSGKTVLMTAITSELAEDEEWIVIDLNSTQDLLSDFAARLSDACKRLPDLLKTGFNVSLAGFGVGINGNQVIQDNTSIIEGILAELKKKKKKVIITIDEVLHDDNMRHFASQFQILIRKDFPVYLLMTGLYENIYAIQNDPALTFLLRTPKISLEPLSISQISKQYKNIFGIEIEQAREMALITKGYAFAFQALGMLYYEYRDELSFNDIMSKFDDLLDDFVYKKIWEGLSAQDRVVVKGIGSDKIRVKDLCEKIGMPDSSLATYRSRLIKKGVILSPGHGYVELALPRFAEVIEYYVV